MNEDRFCKDCRWVTWPWKNIRDHSGAMCIHPSVIKPGDEKPDPVTGAKRVALAGTFCETERLDTLGNCGPDGKNWEPVAPVGFV